MKQKTQQKIRQKIRQKTPRKTRAKRKKKQKQYEHLNQEKRDRLDALWNANEKQKDIARILNIDQSTVSREIARNRRSKRHQGGTKNGDYDSSVAHHKSYVRKKYAKYQGKKIHEHDKLREYIIERLKIFWSPDEISGRMKVEGQPFYVSKTAIYEWLYSSRGQAYCHLLYAKRYKPKKQKKNKTERTLIPNRQGIELRPKEATNNNTGYEDYEGDTIVSGKKTSSKASLSVIYARTAKYVDARKIANLKPDTNSKAILDMKKDKKVLSLTLDNGVENTKYEKLNVPTYFCDPYSSWQKGGIENVNKMLRWFFPKGSDISIYSDEYVKMAVDILNNKPRKSLGYKTPLEVMIEKNLFTENSMQKMVEKNTTKNALSGEIINNFFMAEKYALRG